LPGLLFWLEVSILGHGFWGGIEEEQHDGQGWEAAEEG
jgi:hypothetical protein